MFSRKRLDTNTIFLMANHVSYTLFSAKTLFFGLCFEKF